MQTGIGRTYSIINLFFFVKLEKRYSWTTKPDLNWEIFSYQTFNPNSTQYNQKKMHSWCIKIFAGIHWNYKISHQYLRCVKCCTISSRNTTTKKTNFFKWRIISNLECKLRNSVLNKETTVKWRQFLNNTKTIKSKQWPNGFVKCNFNAKVRNAVSQLEGYYFVKNYYSYINIPNK